MKKFLSIVLCFSFVFLCACNPFYVPKKLVLNYEAFNVSEINNSAEYTIYDSQKYSNSLPPMNKDFEWNGEIFSLEYKETWNASYEYFPRYKYVNTANKDMSFSFDEKGQLVNFSNSFTKYDGPQLISEEESINIAKKYFPSNIDISEYSVSVEKQVTEYRVSFEKYIGNLETADCLWVDVLFNGEIKLFTSFMLGRIPKSLDISEIDLDLADKTAKEKVHSYYEGVDYFKNYHKIEYILLNKELTALDETAFGIIYYFEVQRMPVEGGVIIYDLIPILIK